MVAIIIGTHGMSSEAMLGTAEMIFGKQDNVSTVTFVAGEDADTLIDKYSEALKSLNCEDGVLFMVDLFGGSPFNAASRIALTKEKMEVVTGVNIPMLVEIFAARGFSTVEELTEMAESAGREGIKVLQKVLENSNEEIDEEEL